MVGRENGDEERPLAFHPQYAINVGKYKRIFEKNSKKFLSNIFYPVSRFRATSGLPLDRSKGKPLTRAENLHCRAAFSAVSFCNGVAKTVEIRKDIDRLIVPLTKRSVGRRNYMAHTVWRYEMTLYGTHCVRQRSAAAPRQGHSP